MTNKYIADYKKTHWDELVIYAESREEAREVAQEHLQEFAEDGWELDYLAGPFEVRVP